MCGIASSLRALFRICRLFENGIFYEKLQRKHCAKHFAKLVLGWKLYIPRTWPRLYPRPEAIRRPMIFCAPHSPAGQIVPTERNGKDRMWRRRIFDTREGKSHATCTFFRDCRVGRVSLIKLGFERKTLTPVWQSRGKIWGTRGREIM